MMSQERKTIQLNHLMCISREITPGNGEDGYAYYMDQGHGMIAALDGCGGLGAKQYDQYERKTGAYIAARIVGKSIFDWYKRVITPDPRRLAEQGERLAGDVKAEIDNTLQRSCQYLSNQHSTIKGGMIRPLPTTASVAMIQYGDAAKLDCLFLWAGDSRGYILQPGGLMQCTHDDLRIEGDAFDNLYSDSPLSNMIHAEKGYIIHTNRVVIDAPAIVITATDGTFGYLPSPMHYELLLLRALHEADSFADWKTSLERMIADVAADDSTLLMAVFGFASFKQLKNAFHARRIDLENMLRGVSDVSRLNLIWQDYKGGYYAKAQGGVR